MKRFMLVYLNDARVIGPFDSEEKALAWARVTPNKLFASEQKFKHADDNSDFWIAELESPT